MDERWEPVIYELAGRQLTITPHFQKFSTGWFDTGQYTITEKAKLLGNVYIDRYTHGETHWDGSKDEFTKAELDAIANHIAFKDIKSLPCSPKSINNNGPAPETLV